MAVPQTQYGQGAGRGSNYSYLTPEWLMSDLQQLLRRDPGVHGLTGAGGVLSKAEFEDRYKTGSITGVSGRDRHYYDFNPFGESIGTHSGMKFHAAGQTGETERHWTGKISGHSYGEPEGYKFHDTDDAYDRYKEYIAGIQGVGVGDITAGMDVSFQPGYQSVNPFDRAAYTGGIAGAQGVEVDPTAFTEFTPEMFKQLRTEHYQPQLEQGRESLLSQLAERQRMASARGGALAGYGGREAASRLGEQKYYSGMEDVYSGIEAEKAKGLQSIYDVLAQHETIGQDIGG